MSRCVRDADRLDSKKPHYVVNDVSTDINIRKGAVDLSCTRFKTRIRESSHSGNQVRPTLHIPSVPCLIGVSGRKFSCDCSTSDSRLTRAKLGDM